MLSVWSSRDMQSVHFLLRVHNQSYNVCSINKCKNIQTGVTVVSELTLKMTI